MCVNPSNATSNKAVLCSFERLVTSTKPEMQLILRKGSVKKMPEQKNPHDDDSPEPQIYTLVDLIKGGTHGVAHYLAKCKDGSMYHVKQIELNGTSIDNERQVACIREVRLALMDKAHPHVQVPHDVFFDQGKVNFVSHRAHMNISSFANEVWGYSAHYGALCCFMTLQILRAVACIHRSGRLVDDISGESFLVFIKPGIQTIPIIKLSSSKKSVISNLSEAHVTERIKTEITNFNDTESRALLYLHDEDNTSSSDSNYAAPELRNEKYRLLRSQKSDSWSVGILMLELLLGMPLRASRNPTLRDLMTALNFTERQSSDDANYEVLLTLIEALGISVDDAIRLRVQSSVANFGLNLGLYIQLMSAFIHPDPNLRLDVVLADSHPIFFTKPSDITDFTNYGEMLDFVVMLLPGESFLQSLKIRLKNQQTMLSTMDSNMRQGTEEYDNDMFNIRIRVFDRCQDVIKKEWKPHIDQLSPILMKSIYLTEQLSLYGIVVASNYLVTVLAMLDFLCNISSSLSFASRRRLQEHLHADVMLNLKLFVNPQIVFDHQLMLLSVHGKILFETELAIEEYTEKFRHESDFRGMLLQRSNLISSLSLNDEYLNQTVLVIKGPHKGVKATIKEMFGSRPKQMARIALLNEATSFEVVTDLTNLLLVE